jgi:nicotinate-nucleotide pyrophosphorylase
LNLDGVGFSIKDSKLTPILIEFSGGIKFNNTDSKEKRDVDRLASACIKSIEYTTAATDLTLPVLELIVRFHGK